MLSYDCNCQYCVNLVKRFACNFPHLKQFLERVRCTVPDVHIEGHNGKCRKKFHPAYVPGSSKSNGEGIEGICAEMNQVGSATRQMNHGHRMGVITSHYTYWNWQKIIKSHILLTDQYRDATEIFEEKSNLFIQLCVAFAEMIPQWLEFEKTLPRLPNGIVEGLYDHSESKGQLPYLRLRFIQIFLISAIKGEGLQRASQGQRERENHGQW